MNNPPGGNLGVMPAPSPVIQALWDKLRVQISPFNIIVCVDGKEFRPLSEIDKQWISAQYR